MISEFVFKKLCKTNQGQTSTIEINPKYEKYIERNILDNIDEYI